VDRVHEQWTKARSRGPLWTGGGTDGRTMGHGGVPTGVWPPATPDHGSSPARAQKREGSAGNPSWVSFHRGRRVVREKVAVRQQSA
jgi:hypothetical protein